MQQKRLIEDEKRQKQRHKKVLEENRAKQVLEKKGGQRGKGKGKGDEKAEEPKRRRQERATEKETERSESRRRQKGKDGRPLANPPHQMQTDGGPAVNIQNSSKSTPATESEFLFSKKPYRIKMINLADRLHPSPA